MALMREREVGLVMLREVALVRIWKRKVGNRRLRPLAQEVRKRPLLDFAEVFVRGCCRGRGCRVRKAKMATMARPRRTMRPTPSLRASLWEAGGEDVMAGALVEVV